jgi:uncharacterized protein (UPF0332 family)
MSYDECFERGQLRKSSAISESDVDNQINMAEKYLKKSKLVCRDKTYDISFLTAYLSMFHSARALLFKKGYKERSHFCLFEFIRNEYNEQEIIRLAEIGHNYRETRRLIQYEGSLCSESMAKSCITDAETFLNTAKK